MTTDTILVKAPKVHAEAIDLLSGYRLVYTDASITEDALVALCAAEMPVAILARYGRFNLKTAVRVTKLRVTVVAQRCQQNPSNRGAVGMKCGRPLWHNGLHDLSLCNCDF